MTRGEMILEALRRVQLRHPDLSAASVVTPALMAEARAEFNELVRIEERRLRRSARRHG